MSADSYYYYYDVGYNNNNNNNNNISEDTSCITPKQYFLEYIMFSLNFSIVTHSYWQNLCSSE